MLLTKLPFLWRGFISSCSCYPVIPLFLVFTLLCSLSGCSDKEDKTTEAELRPNLTTIAGKIENYEKYRNTRFVNLSTPRSHSRDDFHQSPIAKDGTFKIKFKQYYSGEFALSPFENIFVHPEPGDSIFLSINLDEADQLAISGDASEKQNKLNIFHNKGYFSETNFGNNTYANHSPESFMRYSDSIRAFDLVMLDKFTKDHKASPEMVESLNARILNEEYLRLLDYATCTCRDQPELEQVNERYFNRISERLRGDASTLAKHSSFKEVVNLYSYYMYKAHADENRVTKGGYEAAAEDFQFMMENAGNPVIERYIVYNYGLSILNRYRLSDFELFMQEIPEYLKEGELMSDLNDRYSLKKAEESLAANATYSLDGIADTEHGKLLNEIISGNKGKVIYLDVWAPFCKPCIVDMRDSQEIIAEEFAGKDIAFVYLCQGEEEKCTKIIAENGVGGIHINPTEKQSEGILPAFNQNGYPFQILINRQGEVIRAGSVYRMMDPDTRKLLGKLLADA